MSFSVSFTHGQEPDPSLSGDCSPFRPETADPFGREYFARRPPNSSLRKYFAPRPYGDGTTVVVERFSTTLPLGSKWLWWWLFETSPQAPEQPQAAQGRYIQW